MVWRQLPKLIPAGSIPVSRSKKTVRKPFFRTVFAYFSHVFKQQKDCTPNYPQKLLYQKPTFFFGPFSFFRVLQGYTSPNYPSIIIAYALLFLPPCGGKHYMEHVLAEPPSVLRNTESCCTELFFSMQAARAHSAGGLHGKARSAKRSAPCFLLSVCYAPMLVRSL